MTDLSGGSVPLSWALARLGDLVSLNPRNWEPEPGDDELISFVPMSAVEEETGVLDPSTSRPTREVRKGYTRFQNGDVLFAKITPCMENGKFALAVGLVGNRGAGSTEFHVLRSPVGLEPKYLLFFLFRSSLRRDARLKMKGAAGQLRVPPEFLSELIFPLPPHAEQQRIVAEIEKQFTKLDAAVGALKRVQANLKRYRAAVLKAAVEGRLVPTEAELACREGRSYEPAEKLLAEVKQGARNTASRRAGRLWGAGVIPELTATEKANLPEGWAWAEVRELGPDPSEVVQVGPMSMRSQDFEDDGVPVLNVGCVQWGVFDEAKLNFLPKPKAEQFGRYRLIPGDVLFTRSGAVGRCAVVKDHQINWLMTFHLLRVRVDSRFLLPEYLRIVFEGASHIRRQTREASIGTTRAGFNTNLLAGLDVPVAPYREQIRIVSEVDRRLSVIEELKLQLDHDLKRSERLRQAILKRAFEGRLVSQDPTDEPASVLLERIRVEREIRKPSKIAMKRPKRIQTSKAIHAMES